MASYTEYRYAFNGVVSTDKTVMQNLESMCTAAGSWLMYDIHTGLWGIVINNAGSSIASFTDSNIIGPITISGTSLNSLYNSVQVQFPHIDLNDKSDYVQIDIPSTDRNANEPDNTLQMQFDLINDPIQATLLGFINLKQSRVDKVIRFLSDYSKLGLKAGDLIDITSTTYGFTNKMFRITSIIERDADDGTIQLDITALEYDSSVYDTSNLNRYTVTNSTGITTIGSIGIPGTPTVDKVEKNARPNITIHSTSPSGIVEAMEFWLTYDVPPGNNTDSTRTYTLIGTVRPTTGTTFPYGTTVSLNVDNLGTSNFLIKTRGINSTTSGPYSSPSGSVYYAPVQITNAIDPNTLALDATGGLLTTLAVTSLLNHVDDLFSGNTSVGSMFNKIFSIFQTNTGVDLVSQAVAGTSLVGILDESTVITPTVSSIDFVGAGVTVGAIGNDITVTIPGGGGSANVIANTSATSNLGLTTSTISGNTYLNSNLSISMSSAAIAKGYSVTNTGGGQWQINFSGGTIYSPFTVGELTAQPYCVGVDLKARQAITTTTDQVVLITANCLACGGSVSPPTLSNVEVQFFTLGSSQPFKIQTTSGLTANVTIPTSGNTSSVVGLTLSNSLIGAASRVSYSPTPATFIGLAYVSDTTNPNGDGTVYWRARANWSNGFRSYSTNLGVPNHFDIGYRTSSSSYTDSFGLIINGPTDILNPSINTLLPNPGTALTFGPAPLSFIHKRNDLYNNEPDFKFPYPPPAWP